MKRLLLGAMLAVSCFISEAQDGYIYVDCRKRIKAHPEKEVWQPMQSIVVDSLDRLNTGAMKVPVRPDKINRYGSLAKGPKFKASGYFYATKYKGRWITVDPEGRMHIDAVVVGIRPGGGETNKAAFKEKYSSKENWILKTCDEMVRYGFNGAGNWADTDMIRYRNSQRNDYVFTYCENLNLMAGFGKSKKVTRQLAGNTGYPNQCILVFDPEFPDYCDKAIGRICAKCKDDPALMGYFSDNEMPLGKANLEGYLGLPEDDYGRKAAESWLQAKGVNKEEINDDLREEFAGYVAERYYSIVCTAVKKHDPNHMYLGSRLHGGAKYTKSIYEAAGRWCDVISINFYDRWDVSEETSARWAEWTDKPFIITEYYTKGEDSGLGNTSGAGWRVRTQNDRGIHYENFSIKLLRSSNCVGWHWFRYIDNDPTARGVDPSNIDGNKGIVDNRYNIYTDLAKHMKKVNEVRYQLLQFK